MLLRTRGLLRSRTTHFTETNHERNQWTRPRPTLVDRRRRHCGHRGLLLRRLPATGGADRAADCSTGERAAPDAARRDGRRLRELARPVDREPHLTRRPRLAVR